MSEIKSNTAKYTVHLICSIPNCERHPQRACAEADSVVGMKLLNFIKLAVRVRNFETGHVNYYQLPEQIECSGCPFEVIMESDEINTMLLGTIEKYPVASTGKIVYSHMDQSAYILFTPEDSNFKTDNLTELSLCDHNTATRCVILDCNGFCPDLYRFNM